MDATSIAAMGSILICALAGALRGTTLARRSRGWRAALPACAVTAAVCALVIGYGAAGDDAASSLRSVVLGQAFLRMFPAGLVAGHVGAWAAHRRATQRLSHDG